jgi:hypothetical protein
MDPQVLRVSSYRLLPMDRVAVEDEPDGFTVVVQTAEPTEPFGKRFCRLPSRFGVRTTIVPDVAKM